MKVLVVGSGAREHALVWKLASERNVSEVIAAPGNPGIARLARTASVAAEPLALLELAAREQIDLTIVGPEQPLANGIGDLFASHDRLLFGPSARAAELESSKVFAKEFMCRHGVPTAGHAICHTADEALGALEAERFGYPVVIKADGLAAGKGVVVAPDRPSAETAVRAAMIERRFGAAGDRLVLEEYLDGAEASFFVITDGTRAVSLQSAEDHKRAFDDDRGPNTGGMGAFAPSVRVDEAVRRRVMNDIVAPVIAGMREEQREFRGFLYVGLMITREGPKVIEFNVRLGDPEAQVVLPMLDEDLAPLLAEAAAGALRQTSCRFRADPHVGVVLASGGYPDAYRTGSQITGLDAAEMQGDVLVFHAGTARRDGQVVTAGGRVMTVVGRGDDFPTAIQRAYGGVRAIHFDGMQYRRDIGQKAVRVVT